MPGTLSPLVSSEEISGAVRDLATRLDVDFRERSPVVVGVLKGAFVFLTDLVRQMDTPLRGIEFITVSSYGGSVTSSGKAGFTKGIPSHKLVDQHVVVVEDIIGTGLTTAAVLRYLRRKRPASIALCALLDKPARRETAVHIDYLGFQVPDHFVVGYGLDCDQRFRELPDIYALEA